MRSNLGCTCFPFITLKVSCLSLLACRVSAERLAVNSIGIPLYVTLCFSLAVFNVFFFNDYLSFLWLTCITECFFLGLSHIWLSVPPTLEYFFSHFRNILTNNLFNYFLRPFLFLFWGPYNSNVDVFNIYWEVSETVLNFFIQFSLFCLCYSVINLSRVFLISVVFLSLCEYLTICRVHHVKYWASWLISWKQMPGEISTS